MQSANTTENKGFFKNAIEILKKASEYLLGDDSDELTSREFNEILRDKNNLESYKNAIRTNKPTHFDVNNNGKISITID